jgi:UDP-N-acetylmuramate-alanine ligase
VLPKSHKTFFTLDDAQRESTASYETMIAGYLDAHAEAVWAPELRKGDVLLTLGAGDVWKLGESIVERLSDD